MASPPITNTNTRRPHPPTHPLSKLHTHTHRRTRARDTRHITVKIEDRTYGRNGMTPEKCESELEDISKRAPMVRFMLEALVGVVVVVRAHSNKLNTV